MEDVNFNKIVNLINNRQNNAYLIINEEVIQLYFELGKYINELKINSSYGDKVTEKVSLFLNNSYPQNKGFKKRNIDRMVQFYNTYKDDEVAIPLITKISWTNNLLILSKTKSKEERHFYLELVSNNGYTKRQLEKLISSSYYKVEKKIIPKTKYHNKRIIDTYSLEFLDLSNIKIDV